MFYPTSSRFRPIDSFTNWFWNVERCGYDEIISDPERFLLTQRQLFDAEGGYTGLTIQLATILGSFSALFAFRRALPRLFLQGHLKSNEWLWIAGTGFTSYKLGYWLGHKFAGDSKKIDYHYAAFYWQKTQNRFDGKRTLLKKPSMY